MNYQTTPTTGGSMFLAFLAGSAVGAVVMALTTPKSGPELRENLRDMAHRARTRAGEAALEANGAWEEVKDRTGRAANDLRQGFSQAAEDLKG